MKYRFKESSLSTGMGVPDSSGIRGGGSIAKAYQRGGKKYPYDKAAGSPSYGTALAYDRGSSGNGGSRQNVNIPKNVGADDTRWSEEITESDAWESGTPPQGNITYDPREKSRFGEDDIEEALGVPSNSAKGGAGGGGGGRPGTSAWGSRPQTPEFDNYMSDSELKKAGRQDEYGYGPVKKVPSGGTNPDDERIPQSPVHDVELGKGAVILKVGGAGFGTAVGKAGKFSRMQQGMSWKESVERKHNHVSLVEAFVALRDTEYGEPMGSLPAREVDRNIGCDHFKSAFDQSKQQFNDSDEVDMIKLMISIDPDYFMKSFGKVGKVQLMNTYDEWANEKVSSADDIDAMTERILKACGDSR